MTLPRWSISWAWSLAEARATGHRFELREDGGVRVVPMPEGALLDALRRHRVPIADYLAEEKKGFPEFPLPSWREVGGGWWEDPATGHLHWPDTPQRPPP